MFQERLKEILETLRLTNRMLADHAGCDRTIISKFKTGARTPDRSSETAKKLIRGICTSAEELEAREQLCVLLRIPTDCEDVQLRNALRDHLFPNSGKPGEKAAKANRDRSAQAFGERLDTCMRMTGLSNIRLSRLLNVDASLISRYRSGNRYPKSNLQLTRGLSDIIYERIGALEKQEEFCSFSGIPFDGLNEETFHKWLMRSDSAEIQAIESIRRIVGTIDTFSPEVFSKFEMPPQMQGNAGGTGGSISDAAVLGAEGTQTVYSGADGLRSACIRFLQTVLSSSAEEIWLYSDQEMSWMTEDPAFFKQWSLLMAACVRKKIRIHIIHCLDRKMDEMLSAIGGWLPLYMSGMIDSYYFTNVTRAAFSHTLFFCPGEACIEAFNAAGAEKNGRYYYHTAAEDMSSFRETFRQLLSKAEPLIRVYREAPEVMGLGDIVITPEKITVRPASAVGGPEVHALTERPFENIRIVIGGGFVGVSRQTDMGLTFFITHPIMVSAFRAYAEALLQGRI